MHNPLRSRTNYKKAKLSHLMKTLVEGPKIFMYKCPKVTTGDKDQCIVKIIRKVKPQH